MGKRFFMYDFCTLPDHWQAIHDALPPLATRKQIALTTGLIAVGTLANYDCQGLGIPNRRQIGKRVVYPRENAVLWLMSLEKPTEGRKG